MFLAYAAHVQVRPYLSPSEREDVIKHAALSATTSALYARLHAKIAAVESQGRKRTLRPILSSSGAVDASAAFSAFRSWLMNYNTVEAVMLFAAVLVCLFCLLFITTLGPESAYTDSQQAISNLLLTTIILAIIYFVSVVVTEIYIMTEESKRQSLKKGAARRAQAKGIAGAGAARKRVINESDLTAGGVDAQMNPMLIKDGAVNIGKRKDGEFLTPELEALVEGLLSQHERPPQEIWTVFQATFSQLNAAASAASREIKESKERAHRRSLGIKDVADKTLAADSGAAAALDEEETPKRLPQEPDEV
jgi:hypothetical protein